MHHPNAARLAACSLALSFSLVSLAATPASAEPATVVVGRVDPPPPPPPRHYADPPLVATSPTVYEAPRARIYDVVDDGDGDLYRAPMRLHLGPTAVTTGRALGLGMGVAADFGRGSVGFRLSAAWVRGEGSPAGALTLSPLSDGLAQYTGELTLDFHKRGPVHPVFGLGFGLAHVNRGDSAGNIGIGTARLGLEYALSLDDADVRLGAGVTGVLPGPAEREVGDVRGYALIGASLGIGF